MTRPAHAPVAAALLWALAAALPACFQDDCRQAIPAPPQMQRLPLPAQVLDPDALAWGIHWGINDKSSVAGQNEGSTYFRASLGSSGIETDYGFDAPLFIPYIDIRAQLLGYGWDHGPYLTLEAGGDLMPTRHIGLALGGKLGPFSPFVAASVGHSLDKDFLEGNAGLVLELREQLSLNLGVSRRLALTQYGDVMADTAAVTLDWHLLPGKPKHRHARAHDHGEGADHGDDGQGWPQPPAKAADDAPVNLPPPAPATQTAPPAGADPCAFSATIDAFDPARWEARARCLDALGKPDDAREARAKAKALRASDKAADPAPDKGD